MYRMWSQAVYLVGLCSVVLSEITAPGIDRSITDGVNSRGFRVLYGDEEITMFNDVVPHGEDEVLKSKTNINEALPPLPAEDVKCLMSVDRYCSAEMGRVKSILIQALKNDCKTCTDKQKEEAGKVAASMMAHDPVAWKMFLTRSALQNAPPKETPKPKDLRFKALGEPEEVMKTKSRYIKDGFKVRVKRYAAQIM